MTECVFCKIVSGELPATKVWENEQVLAFLDINPLARGHTLVIPKTHVETIFEIAPSEMSALAEALPRLARAVEVGVQAEGLNLFQCNGKASGQVVPHLHFHLIPRRTGDGLGFIWKARKYDEGEMAKVQARIEGALR